MNFLRSKRRIAAIVGLLLVLFLWRPGVYKLRTRIANSIGNALGRRTTIDSVRLRLLPRPGFDLQGLVIYDDPAFSPEPMIRADEVSAAIRLRSLLRGRLEIANLSATEPSINLVRNAEGHWNLASLLARNSQIPAARTDKSASERRPAFPYLEATTARVNFKIGQIKKSYALMDADVALWQDSDNSWGARIKAQPVRTDFNLTDTGLLQINATWQRAPSLQTTPVQIAVQWQKGQLGQITKLLSGQDRGWRGGVSLTAKLSGTPEGLHIESQAAIDNFHRYDIVDRENLRLAASCSGQFDAPTGTLANLTCDSPVNNGMLHLHGTVALTGVPLYDLTVQGEQLPLESMVRVLRQAKKQIPGDLIASGLLNADFHVANITPVSSDHPRRPTMSPSQTLWTGGGSATNVRLSSNAGKDDIAIGTVPLTLLSDKMSGAGKAFSKTISRAAVLSQKSDAEPNEPHLRIGPIALAINGAPPLSSGGWISTAGYRFSLRGETQLQDLFRLENVLALPMTRPAAVGAAKLDVSVSGPWQGFAPPLALGTALLKNIHAEVRGLNTPIEITSTNISLTPEGVLLQKIVARTGNSRWSGSVTAPRHCSGSNSAPRFAPGGPSGIGNGCTFQFDLAADQLSTADLTEWFTPRSAKRPWYRILTSEGSSGVSPLLAIQAHGMLHVARFGLRKVPVTQVATEVAIDHGKVMLDALHAQLLQGTHQGNWVIDISSYDVSNHEASEPRLHYHGAGSLRDISLEQVGTMMNDAWISGKAEGIFELQGSADNLSEVPAHSDGTLQFIIRNGSLSHIEIPGAPAPLLVHRFAGDLRLNKGTWELSAAKLETRETTYQVSGSASPQGVFDFVLKHGDTESWALTGTFANPHVSRAEDSSETAATNARP